MTFRRERAGEKEKEDFQRNRGYTYKSAVSTLKDHHSQEQGKIAKF